VSINEDYDFGIDHQADRELTAAAYRCEPLGIVRALRRGALVDVASRNGFTPLMWVAFRSAVGIDPIGAARWLIAAGSDINRDAGKPPTVALTLACEMGAAALVEHFLQSGADPNPPAHVDPPLHSALPALDIVRMLLAAGAERTRLWKGQTALERYAELWRDQRHGDEDRDAEMRLLLG
jgi:ankyrin repeat protein